MLRTADSRWLVSSWLMEWVNIWSQKKACCEEHKLHKKLQREGVYYLNILNVFVGMCAHTHEHTHTGDVNCVCPLQQCMHAFASLVQIIHLSLSLSLCHAHTQKHYNLPFLCVFAGCVSVKSDRSLSKPEWAQRYKYTPGNISQK